MLSLYVFKLIYSACLSVPSEGLFLEFSFSCVPPFRGGGLFCFLYVCFVDDYPCIVCMCMRACIFVCLCVCMLRVVGGGGAGGGGGGGAGE